MLLVWDILMSFWVVLNVFQPNKLAKWFKIFLKVMLIQILIYRFLISLVMGMESGMCPGCLHLELVLHKSQLFPTRLHLVPDQAYQVWSRLWGCVCHFVRTIQGGWTKLNKCLKKFTSTSEFVEMTYLCVC